MELSNLKTIKVKIFGIDYTLKVENEELAYRIAEYVDKVMNEIHNRLPNQPALTVAILAAMNIAEELFNEREMRNTVAEEIENVLRGFSTKLDKILTY